MSIRRDDIQSEPEWLGWVYVTSEEKIAKLLSCQRARRVTT